MSGTNMYANVKKTTLANGLTVITESTPNSPVVSFQVGVKVGSAWESDAEAGLSHVLEHMVFKGTKSYKAGQIAQIVEGSGGELNAYTSFDQTVYYINVTSNNWKTGLNIIKEMVLDALIDAEELAREQEVILEELRRGKDNPHVLLGELLFPLIFKGHPYSRPVIGFESTISGFSRDDVYKFYKKWYIPSNMTLGICGDVDEGAVSAEVNRLFGPYTSHVPPAASMGIRQIPNKPRIKSKGANVQGHYLSIGFPIPHFLHEDVPAIDLLSHLFGFGDTSVLQQRIKEQKALVNSIHSYAYTPASDGAFFVDAELPGKNIKLVIKEIFSAIAEYQESLFTIENLQRAKDSMRSSVYYEKETCEGTARKWIVYELLTKDYRYEEKYLDQIDKVTLHHIRDMARIYLDPKKASMGLLHPEGEKYKLEVPLPKKKKNIVKKQYRLVKEFDGIYKYVLSNGVKIILKENNRLPLISLRHSSIGGGRYETEKNMGLTYLTTNLVDKGTTSKTSLEISEICERMSGHIGASVGRNTWGISSSFLAERSFEGVELFADIFMNPSFLGKEFQKEKKLQLESIKKRVDSPSHIAFLNFQSLLFKGHPYGFPLMGDIKNVKKFTREQILNLYKQMKVADNAVITAVGDFNPHDMVAHLEEHFGRLKAKNSKPVSLKRVKRTTHVQRIFEKSDKMQAHLVLGFQGVSSFDKDHYVMEVINNVLSGQGGRLFLELRDKQSMAYSISSMMTEGIDPGYFGAYIGTEPSKVKKAVAGILQEFEKLQTEAIGSEELDRAKNYIIGNYEFDLQRNSGISSTLLYNEIYGLDLDEYKIYAQHVESVTPEDVMRVAKKYLPLKAYTLSLVGPEDITDSL